VHRRIWFPPRRAIVTLRGAIVFEGNKEVGVMLTSIYQ
jgi:hypothetical protein